MQLPDAWLGKQAGNRQNIEAGSEDAMSPCFSLAHSTKVTNIYTSMSSSLCSELVGPGPKTHKGSRHAKLLQVCVLLTAITIMLLFRFEFAHLAESKSDLAQKIASDSIQVFEECHTTECFALQAAYRTAIATFFYFVVMAIVIAIWPELHFGNLMIKPLLWTSSMVISFLVPIPISNYMISWSDILIAVLDLIASLELISFACNIHAMLQDRPSLRHISAFMLISGNMAVLVYCLTKMFRSSCSTTHTMLLLVQVVIVIGALATTKFIGTHSLLLTTSIVIAYTTMTMYRSIAFRAQSCIAGGIQPQIIDYIAIGVNLILIVYQSLSTRPISIFGSTSAKELDDAVDLTLPTVIDAKSKRLEEPVRVSDRWSSSLFCLFLSLVILYVSMATDQHRSEITPSTKSSFILSVSTSVMTSALYMWTQIAPRLFPHRDFGIGS